MIDKKYADYSWEKASALLNIDSPTGFTKKAAEFVKKEFSALGFPAEYTVKGGGGRSFISDDHFGSSDKKRDHAKE